MTNKCYLCGTPDTIQDLDNLCQDCLTKLINESETN